jgi:hypothetical protein
MERPVMRIGSEWVVQQRMVPKVKTARERRRIGRRPKTSEREIEKGWMMAQARR